MKLTPGWFLNRLHSWNFSCDFSLQVQKLNPDHTSWFHQSVEHHQVLAAAVLLVDDDLVAFVLPLVLQLQVVAAVTDGDVTQGLLLCGMWIGWLLSMQRQ